MMDAKYNSESEENRNDHHKTGCAVKVKIEPCQDDEIQNTGMENFNSLLDTGVQIKQEFNQDERQDSDLNICPEARDALDLKQEPADDETSKNIEEQGADHEVKVEIGLSPVVFLQSTPLQIKLNQEPPESNMQLHCHETSSSSSGLTTLKLPKKNVKQTCKVCNKEYKYKTGLLKHMASHVKKDDVVVKTRRQNTRNKKIKHQKKAPSVTHNTMVSQEPLIRNEDKSIQKYVCDICQRVYKTKNNIITHLKLHKNGLIKSEFFCEICNKRFSIRSNLRNHKLLHSDKTFSCDACQKTFKVKRYLTTHIRLNHRFIRNEGRNYFCDVCNKCFGCKSILRKHKLIHITKYYPCEMCKKAFKQEQSLATHMNIHNKKFKIHNKESKSQQVYSCDICNKCYTTRKIMIRHIERHDNKYFTCDICNKRCNSRSVLHRHKELHSDHYFTCKICQKAFKQSHSLARHMIIHRSSESNYFCDICDKSFRSALSLKVHKGLHSNIYFNCSICPKAFKQKRYLSRHMNYKHPQPQGQ